MSEKPDQPAPSAKPAIPLRKTGLSPAQQKLQAALEKAAQKTAGAKPVALVAGTNRPLTFAGKKTAFQRKAT